MDILKALHDEETKLKSQLTGIQGAIAALNGSAKKVASHVNQPGKKSVKRTMSPAVRARISATAKARWAKIRADKAKKTK
jgi:hypothetical protein